MKIVNVNDKIKSLFNEVYGNKSKYVNDIKTPVELLKININNRKTILIAIREQPYLLESKLKHFTKDKK